MNKLRRDALKTPLSHIIIITLFCAGGVAIPLHYLFGLFIFDTLTVNLISGITIRAILSVIAIIFIIKYGFTKPLKSTCGIVGYLLMIPAVLVCVNNAPLVGLITGEVQITASQINIALFVVYCLVIGIFEETAFRGLVFPLALKVCEKRKYQTFWGVALSSAFFAVAHAIGFIGGNPLAVLLQIGYSFLIGAMCAISVLYTKNLYFAIFLHTVYDIGGLMTANIALGNQWDTLTIIITAILGVIVCAYMIFALFKFDKKEIKPLYFSDEISDSVDA